MNGPFEPPDPPEQPDEGADIEYNLPFALNLARLWKAGKLIGGDPYAVVAALLQQIEKDHVIGGGGQIDPIGPGTPMPDEFKDRDEDGDLLVNLGDMTGFTMDSLKAVMTGGIDNNHEGMVEEYIKVFNYAVSQGIHPGQALLACTQAIGSLIGYAIRSGMEKNVASAMTALLIKATTDAATQVRIVTTN